MEKEKKGETAERILIDFIFSGKFIALLLDKCALVFHSK